MTEVCVFKGDQMLVNKMEGIILYKNAKKFQF